MSPALDVARIIAMLTGKLHAEELPGGDHRFFVITVDGRIVARTKISRGSGHRVYPPNLVSLVARQLWISTSELVALVTCSLSRDEWIEALRASGRLER